MTSTWLRSSTWLRPCSSRSRIWSITLSPASSRVGSLVLKVAVVTVFLRVCCAHLSWGQWLSRGFDPPPHGWSDDHLNRRFHHFREGKDVNLVEVLDAIVQLRRVEHVIQLSSCGVGLLLGEVCTVLLVVENNEEHVVSSSVRRPSPLGAMLSRGFDPPASRLVLRKA